VFRLSSADDSPDSLDLVKSSLLFIKHLWVGLWI